MSLFSISTHSITPHFTLSKCHTSFYKCGFFLYSLTLPPTCQLLLILFSLIAVPEHSRHTLTLQHLHYFIFLNFSYTTTVAHILQFFKYLLRQYPLIETPSDRIITTFPSTPYFSSFLYLFLQDFIILQFTMILVIYLFQAIFLLLRRDNFGFIIFVPVF